MNIKINNEPHTVDDRATVASLVEDANAGGIAIAVNDNIVRRADWADTVLTEGDEVVIIKAAYGG